MPTVPSSIALGTISGSVAASPVNTNYTSIQTAVNALIAALDGGAANQFLTATSSTAVAWAGSYTNYTPILTSNGGGAPALGNASGVTSRYLQIGKFVHYYGSFTEGTTTNYGTGTLLISIPVTAANAAAIGTGSVFHQATSAQYFTQPTLADTGHFQIIIPSGYGGSSAAVTGSGNYPWAWAAGDNIGWNLTYEAA